VSTPPIDSLYWKLANFGAILMRSIYDVAVVGATGAVGEAVLSILKERDFPVGKLYPLASERSARNDYEK
jgi:hypothetical protein